jgi:flavin reductase (DIM6/NTAB) family NADH-FMN oxidoreductase RutF
LRIDEIEFRNALGHFVTGICIVSMANKDLSALGITINSFSSVSLDPPLVLFCLKRTAESFDKLMAVDYWGVNILTQAQKPLSERATRKGGEILKENEYKLKDFGVPIINGSLSSLICKLEDKFIAGDHSIIVGRVIEIYSSVEQKPLVYFQKAYQRLDENLA